MQFAKELSTIYHTLNLLDICANEDFNLLHTWIEELVNCLSPSTLTFVNTEAGAT